MAWRIAQSLLTLLDEVNALYPDRYKGTDGGISGYTYGAGGVVVNPNNQSSHNINSEGVVCAFDITTGDYDGGISTKDGQALAEKVRIAIRDQPRGIPAYPIHYMEPPYVPTPGPYIATANNNWAWAPYGGSDLHTSHLHVSVDWDVYPGGAPSGQADYDTTLPWNIAGAITKPLTPTTEKVSEMPIYKRVAPKTVTRDLGKNVEWYLKDGSGKLNQNFALGGLGHYSIDLFVQGSNLAAGEKVTVKFVVIPTGGKPSGYFQQEIHGSADGVFKGVARLSMPILKAARIEASVTASSAAKLGVYAADVTTWAK